MELTDLVDTSGLQHERRPRDRAAAAQDGKRRLAILRHAEEITGNVALTCRYYGISRQVFYKWRRRFDELGLDGLRDRSSRPRVCPNETRTEVVGKIIYLRQTYHFGPAKIAMYLKRYHDLTISHSGVWRVLKRLDLNRVLQQLAEGALEGGGGGQPGLYPLQPSRPGALVELDQLGPGGLRHRLLLNLG